MAVGDWDKTRGCKVRAERFIRLEERANIVGSRRRGRRDIKMDAVDVIWGISTGESGESKCLGCLWAKLTLSRVAALQQLCLLDFVFDAFLLQPSLLRVSPPHGSLIVALHTEIGACFANGVALVTFLSS